MPAGWVPPGQEAPAHKWRYDLSRGWAPPGHGTPKGGSQYVLPDNFNPQQQRNFHLMESPPGTAAPIDGINYTPDTGEVHHPGALAPVDKTNFTLVPSHHLHQRVRFPSRPGQPAVAPQQPQLGAGQDAPGPYPGTPPISQGSFSEQSNRQPPSSMGPGAQSPGTGFWFRGFGAGQDEDTSQDEFDPTVPSGTIPPSDYPAPAGPPIPPGLDVPSAAAAPPTQGPGVGPHYTGKKPIDSEHTEEYQDGRLVGTWVKKPGALGADPGDWQFERAPSTPANQGKWTTSTHDDGSVWETNDQTGQTRRLAPPPPESTRKPEDRWKDIPAPEGETGVWQQNETTGETRRVSGSGVKPPAAKEPPHQVINGRIWEKQPDGNWKPVGGEQKPPSTTTDKPWRIQHMPDGSIWQINESSGENTVLQGPKGPEAGKPITVGNRIVAYDSGTHTYKEVYRQPTQMQVQDASGNYVGFDPESGAARSLYQDPAEMAANQQKLQQGAANIRHTMLSDVPQPVESGGDLYVPPGASADVNYYDPKTRATSTTHMGQAMSPDAMLDAYYGGGTAASIRPQATTPPALPSGPRDVSSYSAPLPPPAETLVPGETIGPKKPDEAEPPEPEPPAPDSTDYGAGQDYSGYGEPLDPTGVAESAAFSVYGGGRDLPRTMDPADYRIYGPEERGDRWRRGVLGSGQDSDTAIIPGREPPNMDERQGWRPIMDAKLGAGQGPMPQPTPQPTPPQSPHPQGPPPKPGQQRGKVDPVMIAMLIKLLTQGGQGAGAVPGSPAAPPAPGGVSDSPPQPSMLGAGQGEDPVDAIPPHARTGWRPPVDPQNVAGIGHRHGQSMAVGDPTHKGVDLQAPHGTPVKAPVDGIVEVRNNPGGLGNEVIVRDAQGVEHKMGHLSAVTVKSGQQVKKGQPVGNVGSTGLATGANLHYAQKKGSRFLNPESKMGLLAEMPPAPGTQMMSADGGQGQPPDPSMGAGQDDPRNTQLDPGLNSMEGYYRSFMGGHTPDEYESWESGHSYALPIMREWNITPGATGAGQDEGDIPPPDPGFAADVGADPGTTDQALGFTDLTPPADPGPQTVFETPVPGQPNTFTSDPTQGPDVFGTFGSPASNPFTSPSGGGGGGGAPSGGGGGGGGGGAPSTQVGLTPAQKAQIDQAQQRIQQEQTNENNRHSEALQNLQQQAQNEADFRAIQDAINQENIRHDQATEQLTRRGQNLQIVQELMTEGFQRETQGRTARLDILNSALDNPWLQGLTQLGINPGSAAGAPVGGKAIQDLVGQILGGTPGPGIFGSTGTAGGGSAPASPADATVASAFGPGSDTAVGQGSARATSSAIPKNPQVLGAGQSAPADLSSAISQILGGGGLDQLIASILGEVGGSTDTGSAAGGAAVGGSAAGGGLNIPSPSAPKYYAPGPNTPNDTARGTVMPGSTSEFQGATQNWSIAGPRTGSTSRSGTRGTNITGFDPSTGTVKFQANFLQPKSKAWFGLWDDTTGQNIGAIQAGDPGVNPGNPNGRGWDTAEYMSGQDINGQFKMPGWTPDPTHQYSIHVALPDEGGDAGPDMENSFSGEVFHRLAQSNPSSQGSSQASGNNLHPFAPNARVVHNAALWQTDQNGQIVNYVGEAPGGATEGQVIGGQPQASAPAAAPGGANVLPGVPIPTTAQALGWTPQQLAAWRANVAAQGPGAFQQAQTQFQNAAGTNQRPDVTQLQQELMTPEDKLGEGMLADLFGEGSQTFQDRSQKQWSGSLAPSVKQNVLAGTGF